MRLSPVLKATMPFIAGLLFSSSLNFGIGLVGLVAVVAFTFTIIKSERKTMHTFLLFASFVLLGFSLPSIKGIKYTHEIKNNTYYKYRATILSAVEKEKTVQAVAIVNEIRTNASIACNEKVLLYFEKNDESIKISKNDTILAKSYFNAPQNFDSTFNYVNYLAKKQIFFTSYLKEGNWNKIAESKKGFIWQIGNHLSIKIKSQDISNEAKAMYMALFLGNKNDISSDIRNDFKRSGSMHLLAVSGLHVGIIAMILTFMLNAIFGIHKRKVLKIGIVLSVLWLYAMLCGLPPSVFRATVMFSLLSISKLARGSYDTTNSLALSALILLCINPNQLYEVGFQLSFIAVLGISSLYSKIYKLYRPNNIIIDYLWATTVLSFTAQLSVLPLATYYFGSIPIYGLIANIPSTLLAFALLAIAVSISISPIALVTAHLADAFEFLSSTLLNLLHFISELPFSSIEAETNLWQISIYYSVLLALIFAIHKRPKPETLKIAHRL